MRAAYLVVLIAYVASSHVFFIHAVRKIALLHDAARRGKENTVRRLLGTEVGKKQINQVIDTTTPLYLAAERGYKSVVRLLLEYHSDVASKRGLFGWTSLQVAVDRRHTYVVLLLVAYGSDIAVADSGGWTSLHSAVSKGHTSMAKILLKHGAEVDAREAGGFTPLHWAVGQNSKAVTKWLFAYGTDMDSGGLDGVTPLHIAKGRLKRKILLWDKARLKAVMVWAGQLHEHCGFSRDIIDYIILPMALTLSQYRQYALREL